VLQAAQGRGHATGATANGTPGIERIALLAGNDVGSVDALRRHGITITG